MITEIEDYFAKGCGRCDRFATPDCSVRRWSAGLSDLRALALQAGLEERVKWGHPCYMHAGRNIAILGAFRGDFRLTFFDPALMRDPQGLLVRQGPNAEHAGTIRFTDNQQVAGHKAAILAYLSEAMRHAEAGARPEKPPRQIDLPDVLIDALENDPEMAEAFDALTPGRQRSYVVHLGSAKTVATQQARIARVRGKMLLGKGALER